ncbi:MAG: RNA polymerase sigma factor [Myxococcota bacterium]
MARADEELLEAWGRGDEAAGTALFRRYFKPCRRFFFNKVPERDVDDLLQKTFTGLVTSRDRYRGGAPFRVFIFSIARNVLLRYHRDFARRDSKRVLDYRVSSVAELGVTPGTVMMIERDQERVRLALQRIPLHFQEIIELSYWEEVPNDELAEILEIEPTTVRTRLFRARKALAKALEEDGTQDEAAMDRAVTGLGERI